MSIQDILKEYKKLHKIPSTQKLYIFLDEVTSKENYQQELKNIYDMEDMKVYAFSSSASLLKDKNAYLTGRQRVIEVMPLDFEEYMSDGGMPEYVLTSDISYIQNLIDNIIYKDIIAYHNIKNKYMLEILDLRMW